MSTRVRAFLIYGLIGGPFPYGLGYSLGFDALRDKLRVLGVDATTHVEGVLIPHANVSNLTGHAMDAVRAGSKLVLIGHSMGADAAVKIAARIADRNLAVDLLVGFDPTRLGCPLVPQNVRRAICFFQKERGDFLGRGRFQPASELAGKCLNVLVPYGHKIMDDAPELHERVIDVVRKLSLAKH
jgi:pimeloyl-ACP methyl ester carboxylesterase